MKLHNNERMNGNGEEVQKEDERKKMPGILYGFLAKIE